MQRDHTVKRILLLLLLSFFDLISTLVLVFAGVATEANPLMAPMLITNLPLFIFIKVGVSVAACLLFFRLRFHRLVKYGVAVCCYAYIALATWHTLMIIFML